MVESFQKDIFQLEDQLATEKSFNQIEIQMPEIAAQPQFWPKSITITRDADNLVSVVDHKDIHYDQNIGTLTISFGEESNAIITEAIESISPFAPWTFAMEFQSGREHVHGSEFNVIKVTALICKNGKPCGHVIKHGQILRAPDIAVGI